MYSIMKLWSEQRSRLFVALLLLVGIGIIGGVWRFTPEVHAADPVIIEGTLTDNRTGKPIANVNVSCSLIDENRNRSYSGSISTDAQGNYRMSPNVVPGTYYLNFSSIDIESDGIYDYPHQWHTANPDGYRDENYAVPIILSPGPNTVATALEPYTFIIIEGKLTNNRTGLPIANTHIVLDFYDEQWNNVQYEVPVTDANGNYRLTIASVSPLTSTYYLYFSYIDIGSDMTYDYPNQWHTANPDGKRDKNNAVPVSFVPGINTIKTALEPYTTVLDIEGRLIDNQTGLPIGNAREEIRISYGIKFDPWDYPYSQQVTTDADGRYRVKFPAASPITGTYYILFMPTDDVYDYPAQWHTAGPDGYGTVPVTLVSGTNIILHWSHTPS